MRFYINKLAMLHWHAPQRPWPAARTAIIQGGARARLNSRVRGGVDVPGGAHAWCGVRQEGDDPGLSLSMAMAMVAGLGCGCASAFFCSKGPDVAFAIAKANYSGAQRR